MEHAKIFTSLVEKLSAKFPDLDKFYLSVHILGFISGFDKPLYFFSHSDIAPIESLFKFNKDIIQAIKEFFPVPVEQFTESERKDLCKNILEICLQFEQQIENLPNNPKAFLKELVLSEPQAVSKNNGLFIVNFSAFSPKSQKKYVDWEIERYFYYKAPLITHFLAEKLATLANPKNGQIIYDPNCNIGSIFVDIYNKFPNLDLNFRGVVRNQYEWLFCIVNLYVNGILDKKRVEVEMEILSPFEDVAQKYYEMKSGDTYLREELADISVSVVPFAERLDENQLDSRFFGLSHSLETSEFSYIELMLKASKENGRTIAVVPDYILVSSESRYVNLSLE